MRHWKYNIWIALLLTAVVILAGCDLLRGSDVSPQPNPEDPEAIRVPVPSFDQWTFGTGTWSVEDGKLLQTAHNPTNTNAYAPLEQEGRVHIYEWTIEFVDTRFPDTGPVAGVHVLASDATIDANRGNSYLIWQMKEKMIIYKGALPTALSPLIELPTEPFEKGQTYTYRTVIDTVAKTITVYRDGQKIVEIIDENIYTSGNYISARTNGSSAAFYDIKYSVIP